MPNAIKKHFALTTLLTVTLTASQSILADHSMAQEEDPTELIPAGYTVFAEVQGDLNNDGRQDQALIVKGTRPEQVVHDERQGELDRNRRGIIIAFAEGNGYTLAASNLTCFSSEHEDGGVYFPPDLDVQIKNGKLYVSYGHGRYGYWSYTFRWQQSRFEMIGYDESVNFGPLTHYTTSINFSTHKLLTRTNVNFELGDVPERFTEEWTTFPVKKLIDLEAVKDFDALSKEHLLEMVAEER